VIRSARVDPDGLFPLSTQISINPNMVIQIWDSRGRLIASTQSFNPQSSLVFPLYSEGLEISDLVFVNVQMGDAHLRVLSVPVETGDETLGTLQTATSLETVDTVIRELLQFLFLIGLAALVLAILLGWLSTRRALAPLETLTETVLQITQADDLSMRIPSKGATDDEVGTLIRAFNQTLGRMEELLNSQKRFVADVGHELRTPLTVMKGNVDLMHRMSELDLDSLSSIASEVERMTRLVEDLLLLGQADAGQLPLDQSLVELDTLLLEVFQHAHVLADGKTDVRIGDIDQVLVCGDRDRIKQVLLNLIANAINHTQEGGEIEVSLGKENQWACLYVKDNGIGISPEDVAHIFKRFYRVEKSRARSRDGKGFGLGLSIANWIVQNHGGRIEVDSEQGQGTTFCVWLPLSDGTCGEDQSQVHESQVSAIS
jgi:heavy metal sensor kinase